MPIVEILEISLNQQNSAQLWGFAIDVPKVNSQIDAYMVVVRGWVLGKTSPAMTIGLYQNVAQKPLKTTTVSLPRPDVAQHFSQVQSAARSGFSLLFSVVGMPVEVNLQLQVILQDQTRVNLARMRLRHQGLSASYQPKIQPLMVNSLGRSGSTWLMHLLAECPQVIIQRDYPYEAYAAKYWLYVLFKFISDPTHYLETEVPDEFFGLTLRWLDSYLHHNAPFRSWFGRSYTEQAITFCQQSIDNFYEQVAINQGQNITTLAKQSESTPIYFAEKFGPGYAAQFIYEFYPNGLEIILVRDFRDMLCSSRSFTKKLGITGFGLHETQTEEEMVKVTKSRAQGLLRVWQRRSTQAYLVHYEDLVLNPIPTLQGILTYLNLDANSSERIVKKATQNTPTIMQGRHQTSSHPKQSIGRWQQEFSDSLKTLCEENLSDELKAFGYND